MERDQFFWTGNTALSHDSQLILAKVAQDRAEAPIDISLSGTDVKSGAGRGRAKSRKVR